MSSVTKLQIFFSIFVLLMNIEDLYNIFLNCRCVSTDSREGKGLFFGLKGESFDGSLFGDDAIKNGAVCAVTENALEKLQKLAMLHRNHLKIPIIGLTGTNGKTTTKELIVRVLETKYKVGYTKGNFNNHIGVPLTILGFEQGVEIGVVEMGANHVGEIDMLCHICKPNLGLITNVGVAHLEGFGSFEGVKKTKGELYDFLKSSNGVAFFRDTDAELTQMVAQRNGLKTIGYSVEFTNIGDKNGVLKFDFKGVEFVTNLVGQYNIYNVSAAVEIGKYFGVDVVDALTAICSYIPQNNRSQIVDTKRNKVFLDAYNANPSSMNEAVRNFATTSGTNKIVILGDMRELGDYSFEEHKKMANLAHDMGFEKVFLVGEEFCKVDDGALESVDMICELAKEISGGEVLVKGSRGMKMERIMEWL